MTSSNCRKYQTRNPLMQLVIRRFLERLCARIAELRPEVIIDLGCGEGVVAREIGRVLPGVRYTGIDVSGEALRTARELNPGFEFREWDILSGPPEGAVADLALCVEVLEHLERPDLALERIAAATRDHAVVSVPWEPYFRLGNLLRGNYLRTWGNHPEHLQQFTPDSLRKLVAAEFPSVRVDSCFPWLIAVARKRA
jgi:SAM-dependent methyltransferase